MDHARHQRGTYRAGTSLPSFGSGPDVPLSNTADTLGKQRARDKSMLSAAGHRLTVDDNPGSADDFTATEPWYVFDLPMPGQFCASICSLAPMNTIHAFGWSKLHENGR
jgi:hypothetical protein